MTATRSPLHVFIPPAASGQGQAEPQEPSQIPEDFPFKSTECGDCHVEARRVVFSQPLDPPKDSLDRDKCHLSCAALM